MEVCYIALNGATTLLNKILTGNNYLIPALRKMTEAALDAINNLTAYK